MKKLILSLFLFIIGVSLFYCKKHNPEDPWFPHVRHLNNRLEGEWELVSLHINQQIMSSFSEDDVYEDYSNLLEIDTMNIAKFFKFVPIENYTKYQGNGDLYIRTKNMSSYPDKIGISQSFLHDLNDTNVSLARLTYQFREGSNEPDYFKFDVKDEEIVDSLTPDISVFKPYDEYFLFNNFYYRYFRNFQIMKATNKELILYYALPLAENQGTSTIYKRYRLTFKKIK